MQFWPRKRAKRAYARVRSWANVKDAKLLGFAGYKVGMTHAIIIDNKTKTKTKGQEISCPITVIETPPLKVASIRFYKNTIDGIKIVSDVLSDNLDKELSKKIIMPKTVTKKVEDVKDFDDIKLLVYTQPKLTGIGKKKPEVFEIAIGGKKEDKLKFAQEKLGKEIAITDVFASGQQVDIHAITKGKGFQGPVRRFGISLRSHKSEKSIRNPGSLGGWSAQGHVMYRVAHAGKMGFHQRVDYNKQIILIGNKPEEVNNDSGFIRYGNVKNPYLLIKGSIAGPAKRIIRINTATRPNDKIPTEAPRISYLSK
ncbi:MAG: 50S ribosomal protein L3 [Nanoarchaeota archaeon]|nr:50S ribosomal protein L3 [Nanoarchaeota archaeon]MBU1704092.1 50S ribosomal protein L3 [Nanoarchaeota archaeon]